MIEKYRSLLRGMDFDAVLAQIEAAEAEAARLAAEEEQAHFAEQRRQASVNANAASSNGSQSKYSL